jgi:hypothetical protein
VCLKAWLGNLSAPGVSAAQPGSSASNAPDMEPGEVARRYLQSTEFADDIIDFDAANIVDAESTILVPLSSSPLK